MNIKIENELQILEKTRRSETQNKIPSIYVEYVLKTLLCLNILDLDQITVPFEVPVPVTSIQLVLFVTLPIARLPVPFHFELFPNDWPDSPDEN